MSEIIREQHSFGVEIDSESADFIIKSAYMVEIN